MKRVILLAALAAAASCVTEEPAGPDTTRPEVTVQVRSVAGTRTYRSSDPARDDLCAKFRAAPVDFTLTAGDAGGLARASFSVFPGTIVPGSVSVPTAADISYEIQTTAPRSQTLVITLRRPEPGRVRTGVIAAFRATGIPTALPGDTGLPISIRASATDFAGNRADLNQVDIRDVNDPVICQ